MPHTSPSMVKSHSGGDNNSLPNLLHQTEGSKTDLIFRETSSLKRYRWCQNWTSLYTSAKSNIGDRVLGEIEKYIPLMGKQDLALRLLLMVCFFLASHTLSSLINNYLSLHIGIQMVMETEWRLFPIIKKMEYTGVPQGPAWYHRHQFQQVKALKQLS